MPKMVGENIKPVIDLRIKKFIEANFNKLFLYAKIKINRV